MSLVNDMLNDLEHRRAQQPAQNENLEWLSSQANTKKKTRWPVYSLGLILLVAAVLTVRQFYPGLSALPETEQPLVEADNSLEEKLLAKPLELIESQPEPVIKAISISKKGSETLLLIDFSDKPAYEITNTNTELLIALEQVDTVLPKNISPVLSPIDSISFRYENSSLILVFGLQTEIEYQSHLAVADNPRLELLIKSLELVAVPKEAIAPAPVIASAPVTLPEQEQEQEPPKISPSTPEVTANKAVKAVKAKPITKQAANTAVVKKSTPLTLGQQDRRVVSTAKKYLSASNTVAAEKVLQQFLMANPLAPQASALWIELMLGQRRINEAQLKLNDLKSLLPVSTSLRRLQAHAYVLSGKPSQAVNLLLSKKPNLNSETEYYELLAMASQRAKQYPLSIRVYKSLLQHDGGRGAWWLGLAISEELHGLKADARANFYHALNAGRIDKALRDYARRRYDVLAGAVNIYPQTADVENNGA